MAHGHACDLKMPDAPRGQIVANLCGQITFHDLAVVEIHLHFDIRCANVLNDVVCLVLVVQEEAGNDAGVHGFNQHLSLIHI